MGFKKSILEEEQVVNNRTLCLLWTIVNATRDNHNVEKMWIQNILKWIDYSK